MVNFQVTVSPRLAVVGLTVAVTLFTACENLSAAADGESKSRPTSSAAAGTASQEYKQRRHPSEGEGGYMVIAFLNFTSCWAELRPRPLALRPLVRPTSTQPWSSSRRP